MRDALPNKPNKNECAVVNLDSSDKPGTHWVAYAKTNNKCEYFDSYGDLRPPLELVRYLRNVNICYNFNQYQSYDTSNCGHLCIKFLRQFWDCKHIYIYIP